MGNVLCRASRGVQSTILALLVLAIAGTAQARWETFRWWDPNPLPSPVVGFRIHVGSSFGNYGPAIDVGLPIPDPDGVYSTSMQVNDASVVYVAMTAYDIADLESGFSNEQVRLPWRYFDAIFFPSTAYPPPDAQGDAWNEAGFDDSAWPTGSGLFAYGDLDGLSLDTPLSNLNVTNLFRTTFDVLNRPNDLTAYVLRDDAFVLYLNGVEVARDNISDPIDANTWADSIIDGVDESAYLPIALDPAALVVGTNTLAVEVHNYPELNLDTGFELFLEGSSGGAVNQPPTSRIDSPTEPLTTITASQFVFFAGTGADPDGDLTLSYSWNFGSSTIPSSSAEEDPGFVRFPQAGIFDVRFAVTDGAGATDATPASVRIVVQAAANQPPESRIDAPTEPLTTITAGQFVFFAGTGADPDGNLPLRYSWNFGGSSIPSSSAEEDPGPVQFLQAGTFDVRFSVTDGAGATDATPASVRIVVQADSSPVCGGGIDSDSDGIMDDCAPGDVPCATGQLEGCDDNCPFAPNPGQEDTAGLGAGSAPDGIGDACQCGDVNGDGAVSFEDGQTALLALANPLFVVMNRPDLCDVDGSIGCSFSDGNLLLTVSSTQSDASALQRCEPANPH